MNIRPKRSFCFLALFFFLAVTAFVAYRVFEEPGHAEFKAGKAAYWAGNYKSAVEHYKLAADQGNLKARTLVGIFYRKGLGVEQDYAEALKWYRLAAEQGNAEAKAALEELEADE